MTKRPKSSSWFEKFADPFLVFAIFALFIIPAITVFNLTPIQFSKPKDDSVLGIAETDIVTITENSEENDGISVISLDQPNDRSYQFEIKHLTHTAGKYENLIFTAENHTDEKRSIKVTSKLEITDPGSKVSLKAGGMNYVLLKEDGTLYPATIYLDPNEKLEVSLIIESPVDINFISYINLDVYTE